MISMILLLRKGKDVLEMKKEIRIPNEYIERIDKVIDSEDSQLRSREQFIISAIEKKLAEIKSTGTLELKEGIDR
jgi:cob(I)alamin adenosyltransferase